MGFKLKWFRHRLTFDQLPTSTSSASLSSSTSSSPSGLFRRSKSEAVIVTGYYRRSLDEEIAENHAPREFPPIKARAKSQPPSKGITSAPSMPTLTETSPTQQQRTAEKFFEFKKVPIPVQPKEAAPLPPKQETPQLPVIIQREEAPVPAKTIVEAHTSPKQTEPPHSTKQTTQRAPIAVKYEETEISPQKETITAPTRKQDPPIPPQRKESPIPPVPPKRKENRPKEVINEPPPIYSEEDTIKHPSKDTMIDRVLVANPPPTINQHTESNAETTLDSPPPEIEMDIPTPTPFRTILKEKPKSPEIRPQARPHTFPSILLDNSQPTAAITAETPPPLPKSAPPLEDPKPWFEIEEEILDNTLCTVARESDKNTTAPEPPVARHSNPTDELPVLGSTTDLWANAKVRGHHKTATQNGTPPKSQETTPTPAQKSSKVRAFFGFGSPSASPEPPKPKTRRIRVPKQKSPKNSPKPLPRTISVTSTDIDSTPHPPPSPKPVQHDTPLTIRPGKLASPVSLPDPPARKTKPPTNADKGPKQLSFAETATVFSEDDEISVDGQPPDENEGDSWDLVAKHRANINQNATQVKAAARRPKSAVRTEKRVDFVPIDRPRTMREMRKSQSTGAGVNLKNKDHVDDSDTEA